MNRNVPDYGQVNAPQDALVADPAFPAFQQDDEDNLGGSDLLWEYINTGKLNGINVAQEDQGLKIDKAEMLQTAFRLKRTPRTLVLYLTPEDKESTKKYEEIVEKAYNGEVILVDEQREFDVHNSRFLVWLRYDIVEYALHPRFLYLREE